MGQISVEVFKRDFADYAEFESVLGKTTLSDLASFDFTDKEEVAEARNHLHFYLSTTASDLFAKYEAAFLLDRMLGNDDDILFGVRRLSEMQSSGHEFIPVIFVGYDSETDEVPNAALAEKMSQSLIDKRMQQFSYYREAILNEANQFRTNLQHLGF